MLWNTFHKLVLFHHIQFQVLVLTATPNLKINATSTFQIFSNLQKRNRTIMDQNNVRKPENKTKIHQRSSRSNSSPSGGHNMGIVRPQRAQSQLVFGENSQPFMRHANPVHDFGLNRVPNGVCHLQQPWNLNYCAGPNPIFFSSSGPNHQHPGNQFMSSDQKHASERKNKKVINRKWEPANPVGNKENKFVFTLMSYNVLAQDLVENHEYLYRSHDEGALQWQVRWLNILKEIGEADPDIICFQEVQESHIGGYFGLLEKKLGYKSIYKKRTGIRTDGCAIYYKKKRLQLLEHEKVEYFQEDVPVLNRDNVAIVARFVPKEIHTHAFVVATTHLLYNPRRQDVRLAQVQNLMAEVDKMAFLGTNNDGSASYLPIIITGDLNATPNSAVYEFITKGVLNYENLSSRSLKRENVFERTGKELVPPSLQMTDNCQYADLVKERNKIIKTCTQDRGENIGRNCDQVIKFSSGTLSHPFALKSVYKHISNDDVEGTTHQNEWITVDYVFYSGKKRRGLTVEDKLKLISRYQLLTKRQLNGVKIPNWKLGSDHFSLIVKFSLE